MGSARLDRELVEDTRLSSMEPLLSGWSGSLNTSFPEQSWPRSHAGTLGSSEGKRSRERSHVRAGTNYVALVTFLSLVGRPLRSPPHAHLTSGQLGQASLVKERDSQGQLDI